jgi:hypothetical protein
LEVSSLSKIDYNRLMRATERWIDFLKNF